MIYGGSDEEKDYDDPPITEKDKERRLKQQKQREKNRQK
jgi:hypothetical protein